MTYEIGTLKNIWDLNLTEVSHITRSVSWCSLFEAHKSLLVYQFLAYIKLGPFRTSE